MTGFGLVQDFAIIMAAAGAVTLLFHRLRQPPVLGYLVAGILVGPHVLPGFAVEDVSTIRLLADLGIVVLLFGLGLEFGWSKIRAVGLTALAIGVVEITAVVAIGYLVGGLLGWKTLDALFLGCALSISSSAVLSKLLRDTGRLHLRSSRLVVGILAVEDFAAVIMLSILSGVAGVGAADVGEAGMLILKLLIFAVSTLVAGLVLVPRIIGFVSQFHSREALLITGLGLCFVLALLGEYLGLSAAAGAFLMGAILGETKESNEIKQVMSPVRDMFAALFFVSIGMLVDFTNAGRFLVPILVVVPVFILAKVMATTLATFSLGFSGRIAFQVGMTMPQAGEFSLAMAKVGMDSGVLAAPLYPVVTVTTMLTTLTTSYLMRSADAVAGWIGRRAPRFLQTYFVYLSRWLQALRVALAQRSLVASHIRHSITTIIINLLIVAVFIGGGTASLYLVERLGSATGLPWDVAAAIVGFVTLALCLPSTVVIWKNLRNIADEASRGILKRLPSSKPWTIQALRVVLGESIALGLMVVLALWSLPLVLRLFGIGSLAVAVPIVLAAAILYLSVRAMVRIHTWVEMVFRQTLEGSKRNGDADNDSKSI